MTGGVAPGWLDRGPLAPGYIKFWERYKTRAHSAGGGDRFDPDGTHFGLLAAGALLAPMLFGDVEAHFVAAGVADEDFLFHGVTAGSARTAGSRDEREAMPWYFLLVLVMVFLTMPWLTRLWSFS